MTRCFFCKSLVYDRNNNKVHFCSNYCFEQSRLFREKKIGSFEITFKICNNCFSEVKSRRSIFFCNDKLFCSSECREKEFTMLYTRNT